MVGMADGFAQASGPPDARQPAHRAGRRQRDGRDLQRAVQQVAAGDHRRPAGPPADHDARPASPTATPRAAAAATSSGATSRRAPQDVPHAIAARSTWPRCRRGARRSCRSRWTTGTPRPTTDRGRARDRAATVTGRAAPDPAALARAGRRLARAAQPGAGRRPGHRRGRRLGRRGRAGREAAAAGVGDARDRRRADRLPRGPPELPRACCRPRSGRSARRSRPTTWCWSSARRCSPTTRTSPARCWPRARSLVAITSDPDEAARAPMGDAIVGDVALALEALVELVGPPSGRRPSRSPGRRPSPSRSEPMSGSEAMAALADVWPEDGIAVVESPSSTAALRNRLRLSRPGTLLLHLQRRARASAIAGRGRRAARAARAARSCACSARARRSTGSPALWTAVAYNVPVTSWCCATRSTRSSSGSRCSSRSRARPGSTCPRSTSPRSRRGYGVPVGRRQQRARSCTRRSAAAIAVQDGPRLVQVAGRAGHVALS